MAYANSRQFPDDEALLCGLSAPMRAQARLVHVPAFVSYGGERRTRGHGHTTDGTVVHSDRPRYGAALRLLTVPASCTRLGNGYVLLRFVTAAPKLKNCAKFDVEA
jgi:hypothetical protein